MKRWDVCASEGFLVGVIVLQAQTCWPPCHDVDDGGGGEYINNYRITAW